LVLAINDSCPHHFCAPFRAFFSACCFAYPAFPLFSKRYKNAWLKALMPASILLLLLSSYNFFTLGKFSISP